MIYMHYIPSPSCWILSCSWPAGLLPSAERKNERRHWLRLSTYNRLEIMLLIGIISDWSKADMAMNSGDNRLWHVPCFLLSHSLVYPLALPVFLWGFTCVCVCVVNFSKQRRQKLVYYRWINDRSDRMVSSIAKHHTAVSPSFTMKSTQLKKGNCGNL